MDEKIELPLFEGKTAEGEWVVGNLAFSKDVEDDYKAIIIPLEDNGLFTKDMISYPISGSDREYPKQQGKDRFEMETLGFEIWYKVDIKTVK